VLLGDNKSSARRHVLIWFLSHRVPAVVPIIYLLMRNSVML